MPEIVKKYPEVMIDGDDVLPQEDIAIIIAALDYYFEKTLKENRDIPSTTDCLQRIGYIKGLLRPR